MDDSQVSNIDQKEEVCSYVGKQGSEMCSATTTNLTMFLGIDQGA